MTLFFRGLRWLRRGAQVALGWLLIAFVLQASTYPIQVQANAIATLVNAHHFDYVGWEISALAAKLREGIWGRHSFVDEDARADAVRAYFADVGRARALERQIEAFYLDPTVPDPFTASAALRAERDALRADLRQRQAFAEASLEGQVAAVLVEEGFGLLGQLIPPLAMHFTQAPNVLIVSERDSIRTTLSLTLNPLSIDERTALEARIDEQENVASLIIPIGGMALWPAMIQETSNLPWAVETFAHEWFHHYMFMFPLGWAYDFNEATAINETGADIFGKEIAARVLARYYPEHSAHAPALTSGRDFSVPLLPLALPALLPLQPGAPFDFNAAMRETRVTVDALLAEGRVDEAEAYMNARREVFYANGYAIRKLNQAYFAFYGDYQGGSFAGAGGEDPIGPAVRQVRAASPTLYAFVLALRDITNRAQLLALVERLAP